MPPTCRQTSTKAQSPRSAARSKIYIIQNHIVCQVRNFPFCCGRQATGEVKNSSQRHGQALNIQDIIELVNLVEIIDTQDISPLVKDWFIRNFSNSGQYSAKSAYSVLFIR